MVSPSSRQVRKITKCLVHIRALWPVTLQGFILHKNPKSWSSCVRLWPFLPMFLSSTTFPVPSSPSCPIAEWLCFSSDPMPWAILPIQHPYLSTADLPSVFHTDFSTGMVWGWRRRFWAPEQVQRGYRDLLTMETLCQDVCPLISMEKPGLRGRSESRHVTMKTSVRPTLLILMDPRELVREGNSLLSSA